MEFKTSVHRREIVKRSREKNAHKYAQKKKASDKAYYENNRAKIREKQAKYKKTNVQKIREQINSINKKRLQTDPMYRMKLLMHTRIGNHLRRKCKKDSPTWKLIGCTPEKLAHHLRGPGEIDHIFPLTKYSFNEQQKMTNWQNLQKLSKQENRSKHAQLPTKAMASKVPKELWPEGITEADLPDIYPGWSTPLRM